MSLQNLEQNYFGKLAYDIEQRSSYDLLIKEAPLNNGERVDMFLYSQSNFRLDLIGFYSQDFETKRQETDDWLDFFLERGFTEISRRIKSSEHLIIDEEYYISGDYFFPTDLTDSAVKNIKKSTEDILDWEEIHSTYSPVDLNSCSQRDLPWDCKKLREE